MVKSRTGLLISTALAELEELVWPTRCVGCNLPGELLCDRCRAALPWVCQRWACPMCGAPFGWLACTECGRTMEAELWPVRATVCSLSFEGPAAAVPPLLKDAHELRLAALMAAAMACSLDEASSWSAADAAPRFSCDDVDALCFVPATPKAYARRGFDHMQLVCEALSPLIDVPVADVLVRMSAKDQRELGRDDRAANLRGTVDVVGDVSGLRLLLADDVITTGASVRASAEALLDAGAASVMACAFARVWQG